MKQKKEEPLPEGFQLRRAGKRKFNSNVGNLFTFTYHLEDKPSYNIVRKVRREKSKVSGEIMKNRLQRRIRGILRGRRRTAGDSNPFILNIRRNNQKSFKARNGKTYIAGINLNYVSESIRSILIRNFYEKGVVTWQMVSAARKIGRLPYRIYDMEKVKNLKRVANITF